MAHWPDVVAPQSIDLPDEWSDVGVVLASAYGWSLVGVDVEDDGSSIALRVQVLHPTEPGRVRNLIVAIPMGRSEDALHIGTPQPRWEQDV